MHGKLWNINVLFGLSLCVVDAIFANLFYSIEKGLVKIKKHSQIDDAMKYFQW